MNLAFSDEQEQLRDQLRRFFVERCPASLVRQALEGEATAGRLLYREMAEMGLPGAAIPESYGGSGMGALELCIIAEEAGRVLAPVPLIASAYLATEILVNAGTDSQKRRWLPGLASADVVATFAHVEDAGRVTEDTVQARVANGRLTGIKSAVPYGDTANMAIVSARADGRVSLWLAELDGPGVACQAQTGIDPTRPLARLQFSDAPVEPFPDTGWRTIEHALDRAAVFVAFEQIGGADKAQENARDYALDRMAFGRPIGSFQAIKHMLVDMYVAATLARSNSYYAAWALSTDAPELPVAAAASRVSATEASLLCARNSIQVHGGMGFTWEADCHLYYRRANALALELGSRSMWEERLIAQLSHDQSARAAA